MATSSSQRQKTLLINANAITMDPSTTKAEWIAISGGKIQAVGTKSDFEEALLKDHDRTIDCRGWTVLPGFNDAHCHIHAFSKSLVTLDLSPSQILKSITDLKNAIGHLCQKKQVGSWIKGRGYNEYYLAEKRHPTRLDLDGVAPDHPVMLTHHSGHAHVLNSLAMRLVGISMDTADPPGGLIERDKKTGEPTGLLYEMGGFLSERIPTLEIEELEKGIKRVNQELISNGITSIHDASSRNDIDDWNLLRSWKKKGLLVPRVNMMLGIESFAKNSPNTFSTQLEPNQLRVNAVKIILDETTGRLHPPQPELDDLVLRIHQLGMQVAIHAIEERAIQSACCAIENALKEIPKADHRHRIEHCSVCPPPLARLIASLGIRVVSQPPFIYCNGDRYLETVGNEQLRHLYPFGSLLKAGVKVAGSSDCPFAPHNPLIGLCAAMNRKSETGKDVTQKEAVPAIDALGMYTKYGAAATFEEKIKGSITPGKLADLVILDGDPTRNPTDEVRDIGVAMTIIGGEVVWDRDY